MNYLYQVTFKIICNKKQVISTTYSSEINYDECHQKIERWIKKNTSPGDAVETHILHTAEVRLPSDCLY